MAVPSLPLESPLLRRSTPMKYLISRIIPLHFTSTYEYRVSAHATPVAAERTTWWQWRDRIYAQKVVMI